MVVKKPKIIFSVNSKRMINTLDRYTIAFKRNLRLGNKRIAGMFAQTYLRYLVAAGVDKWTGHAFKMLIDQVDNPSLSKGSYIVKVPEYLIALDRFDKDPHVVALKPGRSITNWYNRKIGKPLKGVRKGGRIQYQVIRIKRRPWIDNSNTEARKFIIGILDNAKSRTASEVKG